MDRCATGYRLHADGSKKILKTKVGKGTARVHDTYYTVEIDLDRHAITLFLSPTQLIALKNGLIHGTKNVLKKEV